MPKIVQCWYCRSHQYLSTEGIVNCLTCGGTKFIVDPELNLVQDSAAPNRAAWDQRNDTPYFVRAATQRRR